MRDNPDKRYVRVSNIIRSGNMILMEFFTDKFSGDILTRRAEDQKEETIIFNGILGMSYTEIQCKDGVHTSFTPFLINESDREFRKSTTLFNLTKSCR